MMLYKQGALKILKRGCCFPPNKFSGYAPGCRC